MAATFLEARDWKSGAKIRFNPGTGRLEPPRSTDTDPASLPFLAPALVDLQINGYAGVDFQKDRLSLEELMTASAALRRDGCGRFLLTLITAPWEKMMERLTQARKLRDSSALLRQCMVGFHLEGPFLSSRPGFHGAHDPISMSDPSAEQMRELRRVAGPGPLLLTLAAERPGSLAAIAEAKKQGITVSLGHTDLTADQLRQASESGATGFTHLGNACPQQLDRHDNILWRILDHGGLTLSLIPDGIHVSPSLFRLVHRLHPASAIYYTTDAMSAAGAPPGRYKIGELELEVGEDQMVRQPGKTNFAGSALRPWQGVARAASMLGADWDEGWEKFSLSPSRFIGLEQTHSGNFCLIFPKEGEMGKVEVEVWAEGKPIARHCL